MNVDDEKKPTTNDEKVVIVEQSAFPHQVGTEKSGRSSVAEKSVESVKRRKNFSKRKKQKKKKRRKHRQQRNEKFILGSGDVKSESFTKRSEVLSSANVMTTESDCKNSKRTLLRANYEINFYLLC